MCRRMASVDIGEAEVERDLRQSRVKEARVVGAAVAGVDWGLQDRTFEPATIVLRYSMNSGVFKHCRTEFR